ncbi:protein rep [Acinetobacter baumannii]|jgi:plasmid rolling circle replication initiator protein Rep|uniref:protein rep n=1 Tax=Acinetobacter TaxID=469 RepID=UPI00028EC05B|nr:MULTISPECIES: protein rep [Acinetobacter]EHU2530895.1 protein rep [Acinetobacter baumannii]EHU2785570.1 protein rep [Acinetobacter baumannii]EKL49071.1 replication protein [Acinetobacter baumannii Naval-13]ELB2635433.1 protein rep [Acinetobacter baumannii]ELX9459211.1 protein rep [Acinetobacter baumannii]
MQKDIKKPLLSSTLVGGDNKGSNSVEADQHRDRITRFGILKHRSKQQENYLWTLAKYKENYQNDQPNEESVRATKSAQKLLGCGNFLLFKNFYTIDQVKLSKFHVCNQHLLCPFCAGIRASKAIQKYTERVDEVLSKKRTLKPVLITFTVKNGTDLGERSSHLMKSFRTLMERRRDYLKKGRGFNEFCKINGAMYSYENTYNEQTKEWHPHLHMFALLDDWIDQEELSQYWHSITGDSMIVDIRKVKKEKGLGYSKAAAEVCKYALKFGDLSVENTWEAFKILKGKRLSGAFGSLYGVKIPENLADEMPDENDLPYLEMLYKFVFGKKSYYDLTMTRHVEPRAQDDRPMEKELRRPTEGESPEPLGSSGCTRSERDERARIVAIAPQYKRKKQHWQVSPYTRVRVKQRIKRWDGYLCVIHM